MSYRRHVGRRNVNMKRPLLSYLKQVSDGVLRLPTDYLNDERQDMLCQLTEIIKGTFKTMDVIT